MKYILSTHIANRKKKKKEQRQNKQNNTLRRITPRKYPDIRDRFDVTFNAKKNREYKDFRKKNNKRSK